MLYSLPKPSLRVCGEAILDDTRSEPSVRGAREPAFIGRFSDNRGWDTEMKDRLSAVAEETLLTLAPLDLEGDGGNDDDTEETRRLVVLASSEGPVADLEFIGGGDEANLEDRIRQLQQHDEESLIENEISLRLLRRYASSVRHQQYHGTDIITVRVGPPGTR